LENNNIFESDQRLYRLAQNYRLIGPVRRNNQGAFSDTDVIGYGELAQTEQLVLDKKGILVRKN
jgi:hypothetical protein